MKKLKFVPHCPEPSLKSIELVAQFISSCRMLLVLTGAGVSTESGIPDYRSEGVGLYSRKSHKPMQYQIFLKSSEARQRYWARNYVAWPIFSSFQPNKVHNILVEWEKSNRLCHLVTQNVDNLHRKAGSQKLTELHGTTHSVVCLSCDFQQSRFDFQKVLHNLNVPSFTSGFKSQNQLNPDGDVILPDDLLRQFKYPDCPHCGGILKPDIVFFGDNVPSRRRDQVMELVNCADGLLCLGSTLEVFSSFRVALQAHERAIPIVIVNIGPGRADSLASITLSGRLGHIFPVLDRLFVQNSGSIA